MRRTFGFLAAALFVSGISPAGASGITVPLDEVRTIAFTKPVSTVYVGNPAIADVTIIDSRHAFILGKSFGATNIVALDADGAQMFDQHVTVFASSGSIVTLNRGTSQVTYSCASSRCESTPMPGDAKDPYDTVLDQNEKHQELGKKAASNQP